MRGNAAVSGDGYSQSLVRETKCGAARQGCVDPSIAFAARCEAKAYLVTALEISKIEAVDALQDSAVRTGLVEQIGQDVVQLIMARHFAGVS